MIFCKYYFTNNVCVIRGFGMPLAAPLGGALALLAYGVYCLFWGDLS